MAYKDLESVTEKFTFMDYTDLFAKLKEMGISFSDLKKNLSLESDSYQLIQEKKPLSLNDEGKIRSYLGIKTTFFKTEYYFDYPQTVEGHDDKWKAIDLFEKLKAHKFSILVDKNSKDENKYKLIGSINGDYYEKEDRFSYDTSAIIVLASYVEDYLN